MGYLQIHRGGSTWVKLASNTSVPPGSVDCGAVFGPPFGVMTPLLPTARHLMAAPFPPSLLTVARCTSVLHAAYVASVLSLAPAPSAWRLVSHRLVSGCLPMAARHSRY